MVKSHAEIRDILQEFEHNRAGSRLFTNAEIVKGNAPGDLYEGLEKDGSPIVMNIEMNKELHGGDKDECCKPKKKSDGKKGGGKPASKGKKK